MTTHYETNTGEPLTAVDIKAMKNADYVQFCTDQEKGGRIIANLDPEHSATGFHESRTIAVDASVGSHPAYINRDASDELDKREATDVDGRECYVSLSNYSGTLESLLTLVRTGDKLQLEWSADGQCNSYAAKAGLHVDTLRVRILRYRKRTGDYECFITLHLDQSVCADNTARMIRINYWK